MIKIVKVTGNSLSPFFLPGDYVLCVKGWKTASSLKPGDLVVFDHSDHGTFIKFVKDNLATDSIIFVEGSNPESISSHKLGPIPYRDIHGKVIYSFRQK